MIIRSNRELKDLYDKLSSGDVFIGFLSLKHLKEPALIDLLERGVHCIPSALSQILNRSKTVQAFLLKDWMLPQTLVIYRRLDLISAITQYNKAGIGAIVSKQDHMHCGHGIRKWENIETLYSYLALSESSYPFVLQPYLEDFKDIRVIIVGDYVEAYVRHNPYNFRVNLSAGGESHAYRLDAVKETFCRSVMERGKFPYAHLDLLVLKDDTCYLSEIALNGGTKGAKISRRELDRKKQAVLESLLDNLGK
jgi:ribosomal protein S6--L-glutamate ligase